MLHVSFGVSSQKVVVSYGLNQAPPAADSENYAIGTKSETLGLRMPFLIGLKSILYHKSRRCQLAAQFNFAALQNGYVRS
jgi:hypothetical protein